MMTCDTCNAKVADSASVCWKCGVVFNEGVETPMGIKEKKIQQLEKNVRKAQEKLDSCSLVGPIVLFLLSGPLVLLLGLGIITGLISMVWFLINLVGKGPAEAELRYAEDKLEELLG